MAEPAYLELMPDTVVIHTRTGHNNYGEATFTTTGTTYRCRLVGKTGIVRGRDGEVFETRSMMWIHSTGTINKNDRFVLPDGTFPEVVAVDRFPDEVGTHHYRVMLGH